ncbi:MAG: deiodinase-like protein [Verrucomicrobiaceae bacterium]
MRLAGRLQSLYEAHSTHADFWWIYIQEAHATDGRRPSQTVKIPLHKTLEDRKKAATGCTAASSLKVPVLLDDMEDSASKAYSALPERFFILGTDGKVSYAGGRGPRGVDLDALEKHLKELTTSKKE